LAKISIILQNIFFETCPWETRGFLIAYLQVAIFCTLSNWRRFCESTKHRKQPGRFFVDWKVRKSSWRLPMLPMHYSLRLVRARWAKIPPGLLPLPSMPGLAWFKGRRLT